MAENEKAVASQKPDATEVPQESKAQKVEVVKGENESMELSEEELEGVAGASLNIPNITN